MPTGPRTTMAPFQAVPTPSEGDAALDAGPPSARAARPGRGARAAEERAEMRRRAEEERREEHRRAEAGRIEAERIESERIESERRVAREREDERRAVEQRAAEEREAERQRAAERRLAEARAAVEARAAELRALAEAERVRADEERSAPWSTGPAGNRPGPLAPAPPRVASQHTAPSAMGLTYGDWTRPSGSGRTSEETVGHRPVADDDEDYSSQRFARLRAGAPAETSAIPERDIAARRDRAGHDGVDDARDDDLDDGYDVDGYADLDRGPVMGPAVGPVTGPATGPVTGTIGGRAAMRAERQAAEAARRKSGRGRSADTGPEPTARRSPRRAAMGLVAVAVVALGVLGVYSFASPHTQETAAKSSTGQSPVGAATGSVPGVSDLPALSTAAAAPPSAAPLVKAPVTVLNATAVNGLAASISGVIKAGGWETTAVGTYTAKDIATSTVFFTQGDENQRAAAVALANQFPQLHGPAPRFFDVPGNASPGLVVVATGEWKP